MNTWVSINKVLDVINKVKTREWMWIKNSKCKYVNLRIDMRDGHCLIFDGDNNHIELKDLEFQMVYKNI